MIHQSLDRKPDKGWFVGPWNTAVPIPVGFANAGINEPHTHHKMFEIYLIASGWSTAVVNHQTIQLKAGDMLVVEPGEPPHVHPQFRRLLSFRHPNPIRSR